MSTPTIDTTRMSRAGFSLVEVIIAVVILGVGILGLAGTTAYITRQITLADLLTERTAARQAVVEQIYATPFNSLASGQDTIGSFRVRYAVSAGSGRASITMYTIGPGLTTGGGNPYPTLGANVVDTFTFTVLSN